ncbi:MAG: hypothetical protein OEP95_09015 [Myxococcales bacterium]|nr:hypothetical protein [Myxococcales bacterium]
MTWTRSLLAVCLLATLAACGPTTKLTAVWVTETPKQFENVMILAIDASPGGRRKYEDRFVEELEDRRTKAIQSYMVLPLDGKLEEDDLRAAVAQGGYDAVIATRLLAIDQDQVYVPPTEYVTAGPRYGGLYGYYGAGYAVRTTPGYIKTNTTVRLETHIYDAQTEKLIWAGHSDTFDPATPDAAIESVVSLIAIRLERDRLIPKK